MPPNTSMERKLRLGASCVTIVAKLPHRDNRRRDYEALSCFPQSLMSVNCV